MSESSVRLREGELMGRFGYWFTCDVCGRRSGLFSMKKSRDTAAGTHPQRCSGRPQEGP